MPIQSKYLFVVSLDVDPDKEALFNEVYDSEHMPSLLKVPGVRAARRSKGEDFTVNMLGEPMQVAHNGARYLAIYEIDGPEVLASPEWGKAGAFGRWGSEVRPFTRNRTYALYKVRD